MSAFHIHTGVALAPMHTHKARFPLLVRRPVLGDRHRVDENPRMDLFDVVYKLGDSIGVGRVTEAVPIVGSA